MISKAGVDNWILLWFICPRLNDQGGTGAPMFWFGPPLATFSFRATAFQRRGGLAAEITVADGTGTGGGVTLGIVTSWCGSRGQGSCRRRLSSAGDDEQG